MKKLHSLWQWARGGGRFMPGRLGCIVWFLLMPLGNPKILAADLAADFSAANELYARGEFANAATAYEKILLTGGQSPALLAPRDPELRANLAFVRNHVQGATVNQSWWSNWVGTLTLNEGALVTAGLCWALFALLAVRQIQPAWAVKLRGVTRLVLTLSVCSGAILALEAANHFKASVAVVIGPEATAHSGPFDDAQSTFTVHDGAELSILDRHGNWVQVTDGAGKIGWFSNKQVEVLPGA